MGLLYYAPHRKHVRQDDLESMGLAYAFEASPTCVQVSRGPERQPGGVVFGAGDRVGLRIEEQQWAKAHDVEDVWVGVWKDAPPKPEDLQREASLPGLAVTLDDGNAWTVPVLHAIETEPELSFRCAAPRPFVYLGDGKWGLGEVQPKYAAAYNLAVQWFDILVSQLGDDGENEDVEFDLNDATTASVVALGVNYRLRSDEVSVMGLLGTDGTVGEVLRALIDWPTLEAFASKKNGEA